MYNIFVKFLTKGSEFNSKLYISNVMKLADLDYNSLEELISQKTYETIIYRISRNKLMLRNVKKYLELRGHHRDQFINRLKFQRIFHCLGKMLNKINEEFIVSS